MRILVLGYIVRRPLGGGAWPTLQYALGLQRLGHDVYFLEDSEDWGCCYDPTRHVTDEDPSYGLSFAAELFGRVGLGDRWAYYDAHAKRWHGLDEKHALALRGPRTGQLDGRVSGPAIRHRSLRRDHRDDAS